MIDFKVSGILISCRFAFSWVYFCFVNTVRENVENSLFFFWLYFLEKFAPYLWKFVFTNQDREFTIPYDCFENKLPVY